MVSGPIAFYVFGESRQSLLKRTNEPPHAIHKCCNQTHLGKMFVCLCVWRCDDDRAYVYWIVRLSAIFSIRDVRFLNSRAHVYFQNYCLFISVIWPGDAVVVCKSAHIRHTCLVHMYTHYVYLGNIRPDMRIVDINIMHAGVVLATIYELAISCDVR